MHDHVHFSGKKYIVGFPAWDGNHYKYGAHRQQAAVKYLLVFFSAGLDLETATRLVKMVQSKSFLYLGMTHHILTPKNPTLPP
jgi:hypothetical protein